MRDIDILDHVDNGFENISYRYQDYATTLIDTFINYLKRKKHPKITEFLKKNPRIVKIKWKTNYNDVDSGIVVMRHMETYIDNEVFCHTLYKDKATLKGLEMLNARYMAKILLKDLNVNKKELIKAAEAFWIKEGKTFKILTHIDVRVDLNMIKRFKEHVLKGL
ncbi:ulp1 protease family, C-terminal catalytic domain-containing protein [Artemisia annua]|uniref:Ulp1 protease family, C-terminal catalytic domain-containing protein n=1 Tax=Artemisia annua TaxID=35608 RepID=A0A2U1KL71_ARTAN|nr:ulp1 protease family, C-terminal catalytic domain-containing protein [Artemisia annua]